MSEMLIKENELLIKLIINSTSGLMKGCSRKYYIERLKFNQTFKEPLNEIIDKYFQSYKEKKESWRTCNIQYLRYRLQNNLTTFTLSSSQDIRKKSLLSIINYALMLYQREFGK